MELWQLAIIVACLAGGGILKGATGAGAPILAVPAMAMIFDVRLAVVVMMMPNLLTNLWQAWQFRGARLPAEFLVGFAIAAAIGTSLGTFVLWALPTHFLGLIVAAAVFGYIGTRLLNPNWILSYVQGLRLSIPIGFAAGMLQGSSGVSAPISLSYLNAMRLERATFISTVSTLFAAMTVLQIPTLAYLGIASWYEMALSLAALVPLIAAMPVGNMLAKRFSKEAFDKAILVFLSLLALKLVYDFVAGL